MLKKIFKIFLFLVLFAILSVGVFALVINFSFSSRSAKKHLVGVRDFEIKRDSATLVRGEHIALTRGCNDCHSENYGGGVFIDDPALGRIVAPNITKGKGGLPEDFSKEDYLRALRHGVKRDGTSLWVMPSYEYATLSDEDLGALVYFIESLEPIDNELPSHDLKFLGRALAFFEKLPVFVAEKVDHHYKQPAVMLAGVNREFGQYVGNTCIGCHKYDLKGGDAIIPNSPPVPDLTSTGAAGRWTEAQFIETIRSGKTPEGKELQNEFMPWKLASHFTDEELKALFVYLKSI